MPDPDLTSGNCDGETSTVQLGYDLAGGFPNKRLGLVKHDHRTIVNDDALTAPDNGGDLPGGLKVNVCSEDAEQPWAARVTGTPFNADGVGTAASATPAPTGGNPVNALRVQVDNAGDPCGLLVSPPKFSAVGNVPRVGIQPNPANGANDPTLDGPKIATITLTNPDTVPRLFRIKGRFSLIVELEGNNVNYLAQVIYRSKVNDDPVNYAPNTGGTPFVGGGNLNSRVVTMTHPEGNFDEFTINDQREFVDEVILPAGTTRHVHYYTSTIRERNVSTAGSSAPQRGVNIVGVSVEEQYAVGGA